MGLINNVTKKDYHQNLNAHYDKAKRKSTGSKDHKQYITGYFNLAIALDVFSHEKLKVTTDEIHLRNNHKLSALVILRKF